MIQITFPNGDSRSYEDGITGAEIAAGLSRRLAKAALSIKVNGEVRDLARPITEDATVSILTWNDPEGKTTFWHSTAHLMAEALEAIYPGVKFGIGPPIENGFYYDIDLGEKKLSVDDLEAIEKKMIEFTKRDVPYVRSDVSKADALEYFNEKGDEYKLELIDELEDGSITFYKQGNFTDLCRGPHVPSTGYIKYPKLLSLAGAYWRGDEKRAQLTRIYGISFPKKSELEGYLERLEQAKLRDHRKIGKELELFMISETVGSGLPMWLPKGAVLRDYLMEFLKKEQLKRGYEQVVTPHIGKLDLYRKSGHYPYYSDSQFPPMMEDEENGYLLKPMNCPHHTQIYAMKLRSYRDLPVRMAEFGTVYRWEQTGELSGLTRVRGFTQDDAHIFCTPEQTKDEFKDAIDLTLTILRALDFKDFTAQISLRDPDNTEKYIGESAQWEYAENSIREAAAEMNLDAIEEIGEAAFYGPKLDFMVKDALGREWQLGTVQVDYNLPERFDLTYVGEDNEKHRPVMIHRAPFGSMERFIGVLIEHCAGKFPLWLTPVQAAVLPIGEDFIGYAQEVTNRLQDEGIRVELDSRNEKIGYKIRHYETQKVPYMLVVGQKEVENGTVAVRRQGDRGQDVMTVDEIVRTLHAEVKEALSGTASE